MIDYPADVKACMERYLDSTKKWGLKRYFQRRNYGHQQLQIIKGWAADGATKEDAINSIDDCIWQRSL